MLDSWIVFEGYLCNCVDLFPEQCEFEPAVCTLPMCTLSWQGVVEAAPGLGWGGKRGGKEGSGTLS